MYQIKIKRLPGNEDLPTPKKMSEYASGYDLFASVKENLFLQPGKSILIPTGFALEMPAGIEAQVRPRSGLALKHGITVLNTPGTIDADYRGEIKIILIHLGTEEFEIKRGDRIAQLVFMKLPTVELIEVEEINETPRGIGGFGHTGQ
ncbi:dUTP diphosphatase [Tepidibacillus infernus]|uniref:Deoxyuridine 5'-triphosphate nucleotidohydrolase n=1 Tax=Tepidibacillus decaturensis TaxID=1413211 RepID=A0A135L368_9BACI|nr:MULTISPECIES: dUTP diphosphatase [Tepidibacillus]KXG43435.1 deoxyuridine 5'-triphosphate nucleotidohydrolase [Tepidibacillus decaturensis]GBF11291.1 deoxyuridine 5'-triphosphate nucleotidohydrolase [Tepidibacillus sp. HK-1]